MKVFRVLLALTFVFAAFGLTQSQAKAGAFTYSSGIQVQNLESSEANITIYFYRQDGSLENTITDKIAANDDVNYFPLTQVGDQFNGSVVISSDKQVASISNISGNNFAAAASYDASSQGNTTVLVPLLMKGNSGYNTWFNVQNTGTGDASVTINYSDGTSASATIKPGAAKTFDQAAETHSAKVFSGIVTSTQPVAVTVIEENPKTMFAYSGFNGGSTKPVMPLVNANNAGYQTGIQIQNAGSSDTTVTISYTPSKDTNGNPIGAACTETQTVKAKSSSTFALNAFAGVPLAGMTTTCTKVRFVGSAQVTTNSGNQPLVGIVNQLKTGVNGGAYGAFDPGVANAKAVMPLIMDRNSGYWTSIQAMNVGGSSITITCTFTGSSRTVTKTVAPGETMVDLHNGQIANKYVGSAVCTAPGGSQMVAIVNELGPSSTADQLLVYEGINAP